MRKDLQEKLYKDFPQLFQDKDLPCTHTCMCWGVDCNDGWYELIYDCCKKLMNIKDLPNDFRFGQVKEKYGGLRIYPEVNCEEAYEIIGQAEDLSMNTCEWCGSKADVCTRGPGWIQTLCAECRQKRKTTARTFSI